jgi:outer membrane protein TolC
MAIAPSGRRRWFLLAAILALPSCSADQYRRDADKDVGAIVEDKEQRLFGKSSGFTVETARDVMRAQLVAELERLREERREERLHEVLPPRPEEPPVGPTQEQPAVEGEEAIRNARAVQEELEARLADVERRHAAELVPFQVTAPALLPPRTLSLAEALEIASDNSRDYQTQKEQVYLVALDLTFQRYVYDQRYGVTTSYDWSSTPVGSLRQRDGTLTTNFSISQALATGGLVVFDFTNTLISRFTGFEFSNGTNHSNSSQIDISFTQPLLRGFGPAVAQEPLVQAERNVVYQLRSFERFRQEFAVTVATSYFSLVQQLDTIANNRRSYLQFIDSREQSEALAQRGRRSQIELDQATQSELQSRNSWIVSQRSYQDALDRFKVQLGLPIEANLAPDPGELERLREAGLAEVDVEDEDRAIEVALESRLDHLNQVEQLEDSERVVHVAADDLRAALDVNGAVSIPTVNNEALAFRSSLATWRAGATLDLPVDKLAERNAYREALIRRDQQARAVSLSEDQLKEDVRDALRSLAQLRETFRLARESVEVAERRVQSTSLTLRFGRIQIRDALDATTALNSARNALTSALVDYKISWLELARDTGLLGLGEGGIEVRAAPAPVKS